MFEKISRKIGFTEKEFVVILFLAGSFLIGFVYTEFIKNDEGNNDIHFDYSEQDSLFEFYSNNDYSSLTEEQINANSQELKKQVLELPDSFAYTKKDIESLKEKSIDINKADIQELVKLPGIGEKTAEKIIELRKEMGNFKKLEDLMEVKGIGEVKFNKIKKFLYIK